MENFDNYSQQPVNNQNINYQQNYNFNHREKLPNADAVLIMGIISIVGCWCYGIVGLVLGIVSLILASKSIQLYRENPDRYTEASYSNIKAGRICAIIGIVLAGLYILIIIAYFVFVGSLLLVGSGFLN